MVVLGLLRAMNQSITAAAAVAVASCDIQKQYFLFLAAPLLLDRTGFPTTTPSYITTVYFRTL